MGSISNVLYGTPVHASPSGPGKSMKRKNNRAETAASPFVVSVSKSLEIEGWDDFVVRHPDGHHVQSTAWAQFQSGRGWFPERIVASLDGMPVGVAQIITRKATPFGHIAYLDRGPLVDPAHRDLLPVMLATIESVVRANRVRMLVTQPPSETVAGAMRAAGFQPTDFSTTLPATVVVDLTGDIDGVLSRMKSKTRYNIRKGLRSGVNVRQGDGSDAMLFHDMLRATAQRQDFESNSLRYVEGIFEALGSVGQCTMLVAEDDEGPISAILLVAFGNTVVYKRGAWSGRAGSLHPNEVLHWTAMQWAKQEGYDRYDFDGIEPELARLVLAGQPLPASASNTVTRFKLGFGGDVVMLASALAYIPNPLLRIGHDRVLQPLSRTKLTRRVVKRIQTR